MSNEVLLNQYEHSSRLFQLADRLTMSQPQHILLKNLQGSSPAFVIAAIFNLPVSSQLNHVMVFEDAETAAYFHNSLENLTKALDIFYFPSSFKNNKTWQELNSSHVMLRTEALTRWSGGGNKKIIVTYPEALFEKVVLPETLAGNMIRLKSGESIQPEELMESPRGIMDLKERILYMNPDSLHYGVVFSISILSGMKNPTGLNYLEMKWIPSAYLILNPSLAKDDCYR